MNEIQNQNQNQGQLVNVVACGIKDDEWMSVGSGGRFLPRVQLFGKSNSLVGQGKFPVGHFGLVTAKDRQDDMGNQFDCVILNARWKALDASAEKPISIFNRSSDEFEEIANRSQEKNSRCMWGPEFLLWLPKEQAFSTFFLCNTTLRNEAAILRRLIGRGATIRSRWIESKQYGGWYGIESFTCTTPLTMPSKEQIDEEVNKFLSPPEKEIEEEEQPEAVGRDR